MKKKKTRRVKEVLRCFFESNKFMILFTIKPLTNCMFKRDKNANQET